MTEFLKSFKFTPYNQFILLLSLLTIGVTSLNFQQSIVNLITTLLVAFGFYFVMKKFIPTKKKLLPSVLATCLITFLVWHPSFTFNDIVLYSFILIFALTLKYFLQVKSMSVFNPAALALLFGGILATFPQLNTYSFISWWGASFGGYVSLIIIAIWMLFGLSKWKKHYMAIAFLISFFAIGFLVDPTLAIYNLKNSTILFIASVMLIDPKSSPIKTTEQIFFGLIAGTLMWAFANFETYYGILPILATNLIYFCYLRFSKFSIIFRKQT